LRSIPARAVGELHLLDAGIGAIKVVFCAITRPNSALKLSSAVGSSPPIIWHMA
jgi:hypothetical protein